MDHVLKGVGSRALGLNATRAARHLYLSLGFQPEATVFQCQGEAVEPPVADRNGTENLRPTTPADLKAIAALDREAFGANRTPC